MASKLDRTPALLTADRLTRISQTARHVTVFKMANINPQRYLYCLCSSFYVDRFAPAPGAVGWPAPLQRRGVEPRTSTDHARGLS